LIAEGYQLAFAENGPEALAQAAALTPDVILLDVMMPGMDGFDSELTPCRCNTKL
jgi:CheY-like chemotaxis protein